LANVKKIFSSETAWPNGAKRILHRCFLPSLVPFGQAVSGEKICLTLANQKKELLLHMVPFGQQTWPPRAILVSDWLLLKKSSPLKLLG
jgi:hypothetical protein